MSRVRSTGLPEGPGHDRSFWKFLFPRYQRRNVFLFFVVIYTIHLRNWTSTTGWSEWFELDVARRCRHAYTNLWFKAFAYNYVHAARFPRNRVSDINNEDNRNVNNNINNNNNNVKRSIWTRRRKIIPRQRVHNILYDGRRDAIHYYYYYYYAKVFSRDSQTVEVNDGFFFLI